MTTVGEIYDILDKAAPFDRADKYDNSGLLVGDRENAVTKALVALDITNDVIEEAREKKAELIKLLSSMTGDPDKKVNDNDDTLVSTGELPVPEAGEILEPEIGIGNGIDTTQGEIYCEKITEPEVGEIAEPEVGEIAEPEVGEIADPVEQIVEASEVAETDENAQNGEIAG